MYGLRNMLSLVLRQNDLELWKATYQTACAIHSLSEFSILFGRAPEASNVAARAILPFDISSLCMRKIKSFSS
jgi:hypothetical protein